jgi:SAM-dependent methyltransferase
MTNSRFASTEDYRRYQTDIARTAVLPLLVEAGLSLAGRRVLDVGCGTGGMTAAWHGAGARCVGVDADEARLKADSGDFVAGDVRRLPFRDGGFDVVIAHDCLEHVKDTADALGEMARVLAPDGAAFVTFPPFCSPYGGHQQESRSWVRFAPYGHLLPERLWLALARRVRYGEMFAGLARLSIGRFERTAGAAGLGVSWRRLYVVRPEAAGRGGLRTTGAPVVGRIPVLREFVVGGAFYVLRKGRGKAGPPSKDNSPV